MSSLDHQVEEIAKLHGGTAEAYKTARAGLMFIRNAASYAISTLAPSSGESPAKEQINKQLPQVDLSEDAGAAFIKKSASYAISRLSSPQEPKP